MSYAIGTCIAITSNSVDATTVTRWYSFGPAAHRANRRGFPLPGTLPSTVLCVARNRRHPPSGARWGVWHAFVMAAAQRRLVVLRHAKSARPERTPDHDRPLAARGRRDAPAVGDWLRQHLPDIDLVVCSPAARARQTCDLVVGKLAKQPAIQRDRRVYAATGYMLCTVLQALPEQASTVLLVGHNPGLEDLVDLLTGAYAELKTSTVAVLGLPDSWAALAPGTATLDIVATPRG